VKRDDQDGRRKDSGLSAAALVFLRELEALADVRLGLTITSHRKPPIGPMLVIAKKGFRKLLQGFINEVMRKQMHFNQALIELCYVTFRDIRSLERATLAMRAGLEERIRRLEEASVPSDRDCTPSGEVPAKRSDPAPPHDFNNEKN